MSHDRHSAETGDDLAQQLKSLGTEIGLLERQVTLPPGRARLATRPVVTGSLPAANTIGMTDVACFAARNIAELIKRPA